MRAVGRTSALGIAVVGDRADVDGLPAGCGVRVDRAMDLPDAIGVVVVPPGIDPRAFGARVVLVQVTHLSEAEQAIGAGAHGLIARGHEAGGRVGEESGFILLQRLLANVEVPVWLQGGAGLHTSAAALALGAAGVVLDSQLACYEEAGLPADLREAIGSMDGSETSVIDGIRVFDRPGPLQGKDLPVGQDGAFSRGLRARFPRVADLIRGLEASMDAHRGQASALRPLAPHSPLAAQHGVRVPIAQGPMTRVSDVAGFAKAVADAGGLPFLALSLVRGEALERMLAETRELLGDLPWGAGMLGFAPPDLREEQLAVVRRFKPSVALLAGGRPAQARELEADGVPTYLHVPSPGLLDLFLKDGARRFVLEGRECGGHVGPRTSFVLWEQFVERLLRAEELSEVSVLFAGGVHDARSAAAVATLAAPLALGGAKIGVLMGTAYLFTEEAVATGAITPAFQQAALSCADTKLVHTAPGHATRCADSPFVGAFEKARADMEAAGEPADTMWEKLERLNLGRLRIASKGVKRDGDHLVDVGEDEVKAEGMFMIGQVAALRGEVTTIRALHDEVSAGSSVLLTAPTKPRTKGVDIAIVGMAGFFPGAPDLDGFWSHVVLGRDAVTEVPKTRWNPAIYYDPESRGGERSISKWGGFLQPIPFDPLAYGIPPRSLPSVEPVQILALEAAKRALDDAGYGDGGRSFDRDRASVIFGAEAGTDLASAYGFRALFPQYLGEIPDELDALLPKLTEDSFPGVLANVIAGRIANRLDLGGVNYTVDAACASSLAALDLACKELAGGTSDVVLAGGADLHNAVNDFLLFSSVHALSRTGRCRPFDADADGIALGEGVAVVVCKRLADAERDGDRIYAVVKGISGSSDGRHLGLTAPRKEGQMRALTRAYVQAGVSPADVGLAEAHGTGTVVGDRTELGTLTEVFAGGAASPGSITLGSVKSNIGHTKCAAGLAGVVKCALALHHRVLPPSIHIRKPNPGWVQHTSPFVFRAAAAPWVGPERHAAVSAFGFGGTNFHCVLASHDTSATHGLPEWPAELLLFKDLHDLDRVKAHLEAGERVVDLAAALATRGSGAVKVAIVAEGPDDLREKLDRAIAGEGGRGVFHREPIPGDLVFVFPGQGSQRPGMLAELFVAFPWLQDGLPADWAARLFPGDAFDPASRKAQRDALTDTRVAQPALGLVDRAAARLLEALGLKPARLVGHSYGELVALTVAGALPEPALVGLSETRGRLILDAAGSDPGTMAAVKSPSGDVQRALDGCDGVVLANLNSPSQTVISGTTAGIAEATRRLEAAGLEVASIPVAAAFHSPVVAAARDGLHDALSALDVRAPDRPVYANATAEPYGSDVAGLLADQVREPVRFQACIERIHADGGSIFVEVGPGRVLTRLVQQILADRPVLARSLEDKRGGGALSGLVRLLAQLVAAGQTVDPTVLYAGRARPLDLEAPPRRPSPTAWWVDGQRAWPVKGELPDYALKVVDAPLQLSGVGAREKVVLEYLETLRVQAEQQRRVVLQYLGDAPLDELPPLITETAPLPPASAMPAESRRSPEEVLLEVVSERTGYPAEMLELDLDLEADLSIDSIKRIEILGVLGERLGIDAGEAGRDQLVEQLSGVKTLRGILDRLGDTGGPSLQRWVGRVEPLPAPEPGTLAGLRVGVGGRLVDGPLREALSAGLGGEGARVQAVESDADLDGLDALVWLVGTGGPGEPPLSTRILGLASTCRAALTGGVKRILVVTSQGGLADRSERGSWAAGVSGLVKSVAREWPGSPVRRVDLEPSDDAVARAEAVCAELSVDFPVEVGWSGGARTGRTWVAAPLDGDPVALSPESVVLLTGGARGITARAAIALAERTACAIALFGRSPEPAPEPPELASHADAPSLRRHLAGTGLKPAEIEPKVRRILADREMRATFEALRRTGSTFEYTAVDVRDPDAVRAAMDGVYDRMGRVDWVIHGAGVNEDKLLADKTVESFLRVFDTKVAGAHALLAGIRDASTRVAFFSSVAGAFGNRGQVDYAAANDALDTLARALSSKGTRTVSVGWGPWAGGGMVDASLERQYAERGIGLVAPDEGVDALLRELGAGGVPHAVWMASTPQDMG